MGKVQTISRTMNLSVQENQKDRKFHNRNCTDHVQWVYQHLTHFNFISRMDLGRSEGLWGRGLWGSYVAGGFANESSKVVARTLADIYPSFPGNRGPPSSPPTQQLSLTSLLLGRIPNASHPQSAGLSVVFASPSNTQVLCMYSTGLHILQKKI